MDNVFVRYTVEEGRRKGDRVIIQVKKYTNWEEYCHNIHKMIDSLSTRQDAEREARRQSRLYPSLFYYDVSQ